jgi:hypothetical protein
MSSLCVAYAPFGTRRTAPQPPVIATKSQEPSVTTTSAEAPVITSANVSTETTGTSDSSISAAETTGTANSSAETTQGSPATTTATVIITSASGIESHTAVPPATTPPPPPPKVDSCPPPLPESWIVMNNLNRTEISLASAACTKVVKAVAQGKTFVPAPIVQHDQYQQSVNAALPEDYCVKPPSGPKYAQSTAPEAPIYSGSERSAFGLGFFATVLAVLL